MFGVSEACGRPGIHTAVVRPSASKVAEVTFPLGSVDFFGEPQAGLMSVVDVSAVSGPDPSGSGVVCEVDVNGPPVDGVYVVVVVRFSASLVVSGRPWGS